MRAYKGLKMSLSKSLVQFQLNLKPINKDSVNPFFKSNYLSLSGILEIAVPELSKCGISLSQPMRVDNGVTILQTKLTHENGESFVSEMILPVVLDPQKLGSLITYYKRYQLQAMLGISSKDDDDDGNSVSQDVAKTYSKQQDTAPLASKAQIDKIKELYSQDERSKIDPKTLTSSGASMLISKALANNNKNV